jgi:hypothetical protein
MKIIIIHSKKWINEYLKRKRDDSADDDHDGECEEGLRLPNAL